MDKTDFLQSLEYQTLPEKALSIYLKSMWYDAKGNWDKAHSSIQDLEDPMAQQIHAYLHRKEGDLWNAGYWYDKIGMKTPVISLDQEWNEIVDSLL
ncbi:MAG: hypothetical protein ABI761_13830 [Saprospiraceae bacterium]